MYDPYSFQEYQQAAIRTLLYPGQGELLGLAYVGLGLAGEAGEVAEKLKKLLRDAPKEKPADADARGVTPELRQNLILELGDVLWYVAAMCKELGTTIDEVANKNVAKLSSRAARGKIQGNGDHR